MQNLGAHHAAARCLLMKAKPFAGGEEAGGAGGQARKGAVTTAGEGVNDSNDNDSNDKASGSVEAACNKTKGGFPTLFGVPVDLDRVYDKSNVIALIHGWSGGCRDILKCRMVQGCLEV